MKFDIRKSRPAQRVYPPEAGRRRAGSADQSKGSLRPAMKRSTNPACQRTGLFPVGQKWRAGGAIGVCCRYIMVRCGYISDRRYLWLPVSHLRLHDLTRQYPKFFPECTCNSKGGSRRPTEKQSTISPKKIMLFTQKPPGVLQHRAALFVLVISSLGSLVFSIMTK